MRIDVPVGTVVPRDVVRAGRMADEQVFHLAAAVDQHGLRILLQEIVRFPGLQVLHGVVPRDRLMSIMRRRSLLMPVRADCFGNERLRGRLIKFAAPARLEYKTRTIPMQPDRTAELTRLLRERILVLDGAWGTMIQERQASAKPISAAPRPAVCTTIAAT